MAYRTPFAAVSVLAGAIVLVAGCSGGGGGEPIEEPSGSPEETTVESPDGPFIREGVLGGPAEFRARIEVTAVERRDDRTVVRFVTTPLDEGEQTVRGAFGGKSSTPVGFRLLDPVGERIYRPLVDGDGGGVLGTELPTWVVGEVEYTMEAHFPRLPEDVSAVTLITPGTTAEMTGIPVEEVDDPGEAPSEEPPNYLDLAPGELVELPVDSGPIEGDPDDRVSTLYSVVQKPGEERDTAGDRVRITVPAGEVFADGGAELSRDADDVLHRLVTEFHDRADPEKDIKVTVHTAAAGEAEANEKLSKDRAKAAEEFLAEGAGDGYTIVATGKGGEEPVADEGGVDIEKAQARNHRIEVSYRVLEQEEKGDGSEDGESDEDASEEPAEGPSEAGGPEPGPGSAGPLPAPFRSQEAPRVARNTGWTRDFDFELDVLPAYRDGEFLVVNMVIRNITDPETVQGEVEIGKPFAGEYEGSHFGDFRVVDPESGIAYREVRIGGTRPHEKEGGVDYVESPGNAFFPEPGWEGRVFLYVPAPPAEVGAVTLDAGLFGGVEGVPVE
ncbi:OmpA family protein [Nocardiopsis suaedae]|uniref:OmpA family protein n=1 Tax=Nocardiopsis suaedae TaxID=3018444 RepID=A0ABT4TV17_9ACTN|nr:OmpA family protein [Nocardiopsis suaedae]MDA2808548.1 OmpA family protein [Nocardiopsis suaedae]